MYRIGKEEIEAVARVIESKDFFKINNSHRECEKAENKMCAIWDVKNSILMTSGHAALVSALVGMGIGPGDEVIVPAYTYMATALSVVAAGAIPVIAEVDETLTLDIVDTEKKISPRTKAILPVHIQGFPCNMDGIMALAEKYNLQVLEDACQADGGTYKGKRLGSIGNAGALSFNYFKVITCGEGGALLTNDKKILEKAMIYHDSNAIAFFGDQLSGNETEVFCGHEFRSNDINAAIIGVQLDRMDGILADLRKNKKLMMDALSDCLTFAPTYDAEGDCGTTLAVRFETEEAARSFARAEGVYGVLPIDTGKHVYTNWTPIMEKRGALHPAMDPYKMAENSECNMNYSMDMCPNTLDLLARTVYISVNPDATQEAMEQKIACLRKAVQA